MKFFRLARKFLVAAALFCVPISGFAAYVTSVVPPGQSTAGTTNFVGRSIDVMDFGAKCDVATGSGTFSPTHLDQFTTSATGAFATAYTNEHIVITGADNWVLSGWVTGGSKAISSVGYSTSCTASGCGSSSTFHPSLIGAAGGASIDDSGSLHVITGKIQTGAWYSGSNGTTPETGTLPTTTGSTSNGSSMLTVASTNLQLIGQNGQPVFDTSGVAVTPPLRGMPISSSSGDIPSGAYIVSASGTTITLSANATNSTSNETILVGGNIIMMDAAAGGAGIAQTDTFKLPGAPLATTIKSIAGDTITLNASAVSATQTWVATRAIYNSSASGYQDGDFIQVGDVPPSGAAGTTLQVVHAVGGVPSNTNVYAQVQLLSTPLSISNELHTSSLSGAGGNFTIQYIPSWKYWFGTDDSAAINLALSGGFSTNITGSFATSSPTITGITPSTMAGIVIGMSVNTPVGGGPAIQPLTTVLRFDPILGTITMSKNYLGPPVPSGTVTITGPQIPQGSDIWLPANRACGVASSINLPYLPGQEGNTSLRGWDAEGSKIVALAQMPVDTYGYSYVVGVPASNYPRGGGMRDLSVEALKLSQFACGIEGGEFQSYHNVSCRDAITSEWLCGYPLVSATNNQIYATVFDHVTGTTVFDEFGPISNLPNANFLTAPSCSGQEVVNSSFVNGWINILDSQNAYNLYLGNVEDSIEPFNPEYCVELTGPQMVSDNRCDDASAATVYVTGSKAVAHDVFGTWDNAWPWTPGKPLSFLTGTTYDVLLGPGTFGNLVDGAGGGSRLASGSQIVAQQGPPDPTTIVTNSPGATFVVPGPGYGLPNPQGRLTLQTHTPVMTSNSVAQSTIYYDCFNGPNVPFFNGGSDQLDTIGSCEISLPLSASVEHTNDVFDIWWWHNGGSPVLCVATNGSGKGWTGDGGNLNQRGTGYTQLAQSAGTSRGYITNANAFVSSPGGSHCYGAATGTVDYVALAPGGQIPAGELTYLGSFYTTVAGQTSFNPAPSPAAPGPQALVGVCNAYNQVPVTVTAQDNHTGYSAHGTPGWEVADAAHSGINNILALDCLSTLPWNVQLIQPLINGGMPASNPELSIELFAVGTLPQPYSAGTACVPSGTFPTPSAFASQQALSLISVTYSASSLPLTGVTCAQAVESVAALGTNNFNPNLAIQMPWQY